MTPTITAALLLLASASRAGATADTARADCALPTADSAWTATALAGWRRVSERALHAGVQRYPVIVLFDQRCTHTFTPTRDRGPAVRFVSGGQRFSVASVAHGDSVTVPDGSHIPVRLTSFSSPGPGGTMSFVMALPSIWLESAAGARRDLLATAVFVHEFTHTQNFALGQRVDSLIHAGLPEDTDDDVIQKRFGARPAFKADYEAERDTLFAAAAAPSRAAARRLASKALAIIGRRRAAAFIGADSLYAPAEDLFLSMEGAAQWLAYRWLVDPQGGAMSPADAMPFIRRGGKHWSQDEGLALLLVVSRLDPNAPSRLFARRPQTILSLLGDAVTGPMH